MPCCPSEARLSRFICLAAITTLIASAQARAASWRVNEVDDAKSDGSCDDPKTTAVDCTLRDAIDASNSNPGPDVIILPFDVVLTVAGTDDANAVGDLDVWDDLSGASLLIRPPSGVNNATITASFTLPTDRVLHILPLTGSRQAVDVELRDITLAGGTVAYGAVGGGCIAAEAGSLTLTNVAVEGCETNGTVTNRGGGGVSTTVPLSVVDSDFQQNTATSQHGGAIYATGPVDIDGAYFYGNVSLPSYGSVIGGGGLFVLTTATAAITESRFQQNQAAEGYGGGAWVQADDVSIRDVEFEGNIAADGGGLYTYTWDGSTNQLHRLTFVQNRAYETGGGLRIDSLDTTNPTIQVWNSTFSGNIARSLSGTAGNGAGAYLADAGGAPTGVPAPGGTAMTVEFNHCTFYDNLLAGSNRQSVEALLGFTSSTADVGASVVDSDCPGIGSLGGNLAPTMGYPCIGISDNIAVVTVGSLQYNGGSYTRSHELTQASGIDWVACSGDVSQNMVSRPSSGSTCDSGSYEQ